MNKIIGVTRAIGFIESHLSEKLDLEIVAGAVNYSRFHLHRMFTSTVGLTIHEYVNRRRLTEAAKLLVFSQKSIMEIALEAGYESQQAFHGIFKAMYKKTPFQFRNDETFYPLQLAFQLVPDRRRKADPLTKREILYAKTTDIPAWMALVRLVIDGFPNLQQEEYACALRRCILEKRALIMKDGAKAIGIMMLSHESGSIAFFGIHPLYKKQGLAQLFLDRAILELTGHIQISITTFREGDKADTGHRRAIQALGFSEAELLTEFGYPTQRMVVSVQKKECANHEQTDWKEGAENSRHG